MADRSQELFDTKHRLQPRALRLLGNEELTQLRRVAQDTSSENRVRALGMLATARADDTAIFAGIVTNRDEPADVRAVAAGALARFASAAPALVEALGAADTPALRTRVLLGLARVGTAAALEAVQKYAGDDDQHVRTAALYAQALIAARAQDDKLAPRIATEPVTEELAGFTFKLPRAPLGTVADVLEELETGSFGVTPDRDLIYMVDCLREGRVLVLDHSFAKPDDAPKATRPLGLVLMHSDEDGSYSVLSVIISQGDERGPRVFAFRTDGRVWLAGQLEQGGRFQLSSVRGPGNVGLRMAGAFDGAAFQLTESVATRAVEKQMPRRIDGPT